MKHACLPLILATTLAWTLNAPAENTATRNLFEDGLNAWVRFLPDANANPDNTWSVRDGVVYCTGKPTGYIRTRDSFRDYVIHLEWSWTGEPGNSGLLLHINGDDAVWPICIESQLKNGNAGDIHHMGGATSAELKQGRRIQKQQAGNEKPAGEWNEMDVTCRGDTLTIRVNGVVQNQATGCSVTSGPIALQSEGRPIAFRNVTLTPITR